jgi:hypothetical protein
MESIYVEEVGRGLFEGTVTVFAWTDRGQRLEISRYQVMWPRLPPEYKSGVYRYDNLLSGRNLVFWFM